MVGGPASDMPNTRVEWSLALNVTACNVKEVYPKRGMLSTAPDQLTFTGWTGGEKTVC